MADISSSRNPTPDFSSSEHNIICGLEYLTGEAIRNEQPKVATILRQAIMEISATHIPLKGIAPFDYSDVLQAFKVVAKFCLIEDPEAKEEAIRMMTEFDKKTLALINN